LGPVSTVVRCVCPERNDGREIETMEDSGPHSGAAKVGPLRKNEQCGSFDFVIVGAGTAAMGLIFGLLKGNRRLDVAVVERGNYEPGSSELQRWFHASHSRESLDVQCLSAVAPGHRSLDIPTGQGLGGTSRIHAGLCLAPPESALSWLPGLTHSIQEIQVQLLANSCLVTYRSGQATTGSASSFSTQSLACPTVRFPSVLYDIPCTVKMGDSGVHARSNYYQALVQPLLSLSENVTISWFMGHEVERLLWEYRHNQRVVTGVECKVRGETIQQQQMVSIYGTEVIVCAGALETPVLLAASFPADTVVASRTLRDHVMVSRTFWSFTPPSSLRFPSHWTEQTEHDYSPTGAPPQPDNCWNGVSAMAWLRTSIESPTDSAPSNPQPRHLQMAIFHGPLYTDLVPHVVASLLVRRKYSSQIGGLMHYVNNISEVAFQAAQWSLTRLLKWAPLRAWLENHVVTLGIFLLDPVSTGTIHVHSQKNTTAMSTEPMRRSNVNVSVDLNYLNDESDVQALYQGWIQGEQVVQDWKVLEIFPGPLIRSWWRGSRYSVNYRAFRSFAQFTCLPYFHWCGTVPMSTTIHHPDPANRWTVDQEFRVTNVQRLRVCDASILPQITPVPTALSCAGYGYYLASLLVSQSEFQAPGP
jgi:choline dehydrogenase-like flavoprotein